MARLSHPCIVAVHDAGETPGGLLFFVMDYVEGTDVQQMLATGGRLPLEEALRITTCVCDALAYAHGEGIIHRDIKPSTVMLGYDRQVKVADFGLAKVASTHSSLLTASDAMLGTPDFMAAESHLGTAQVDHRADLYAVGQTIIARCNGQTITAQPPDQTPDRISRPMIYNLRADAFRKLEVINLDGLPEAEARKAAGLDAAAAK